MCYMLFCAVMCAISASGQGDNAYSIMLFSIICTYGGAWLLCSFNEADNNVSQVYFVSSILSFAPWHMFTSFIPYMLLSPTYINILQMYAHSFRYLM